MEGTMAGGGGKGRPAEILPVGPPGIFGNGVLLYIEASQAGSAAHQEQKRDEVAGIRKLCPDGIRQRRLDELNAPGEGQNGGSQSEADDVGQRVHLAPE